MLALSLLAASCVFLRKECRMHFNLVVGSYLLYLLLFLAIKDKTKINKHRHKYCSMRSSVVPLPQNQNPERKRRKLCNSQKSVYMFYVSLTKLECRALADYSIVQTKSVCVLVVICIQIFIWFVLFGFPLLSISCLLFVAHRSYWPCHSGWEKEKIEKPRRNRPTKSIYVRCWW